MLICYHNNITFDKEALVAAIYYKIFEYYKNQILTNQMKSGQKMPTEEAICEFFNASRITTRHGLEMLVNQGLIVKIQGKGTFVSEKKASLQLNELTGFSAEMRMLGKEPSTIVLGVNLVEPSEKVAEKLNLPLGRKVYVIERIRCADGIKMALEKVSLPFHFVPDINKYDVSKSLYTILSEKYMIEAAWATETLEAALSNQKISETLDIKANSPVLHIERTSYDRDNNIYEYTESIYRGDKYKFTATMKR